MSVAETLLLSGAQETSNTDRAALIFACGALPELLAVRFQCLAAGGVEWVDLLNALAIHGRPTLEAAFAMQFFLPTIVGLIALAGAVPHTMAYRSFS